MCGIVGAISEKRDVLPILIEGLSRLEYRGYDSAGLAFIEKGQIQRYRVLGKVQGLGHIVETSALTASLGIAHTRWATHGKPNEKNAHPHLSHGFALVHNGIIENHEILRQELKTHGYVFSSETDTEVIVHLMDFYYQSSQDLFTSIQKTISRLKGSYAIALIHENYPKRMIALRRGSPLVIGLGQEEIFLASDSLALLPFSQAFIYLEEGDMADICAHDLKIYDLNAHLVKREIKRLNIHEDAADKGRFAHFMQKEIFEQSQTIAATLEGRLFEEDLSETLFEEKAQAVFAQIKHIQLVACGTSYHAGLVARYWLEALAGISCHIEVASEFRYREVIVAENSLLLCISQSGETADTLAALRQSKSMGYLASLAICNVLESTLLREADFSLLTRAGREISVASTKAFTAQLSALLLFTLNMAKQRGKSDLVRQISRDLQALPGLIDSVLLEEQAIKQIAPLFKDKNSTLFLGRGSSFPLALEGALKLKEISYIHAEGYAAGELKHGPIALIDKNMPVIIIAPTDACLEKLKSNIEEVRSREGEIIVFTDKKSGIDRQEQMTVFYMPEINAVLSPILYSIPLQLLSYHVAILRGAEVDQPRNLAKSVTVE